MRKEMLSSQIVKYRFFIVSDNLIVAMFVRSQHQVIFLHRCVSLAKMVVLASEQLSANATDKD